MAELPQDVIALVEHWTGQQDAVHWWECCGTYFICAMDGDCLYFLRIFQVGGRWSLSVDKTASAMLSGKGSDVS